MMTQDDCLNKGTRDTTCTHYKTLNQGEPSHENGFILHMLGIFSCLLSPAHLYMTDLFHTTF